MADNTLITPGTGASIRSHDKSGVQVQVVETYPHAPSAANMSSVAINVAASGNSDLVALVALQSIKVMGLELVADGGAVKVKLFDGTTPTDMCPAIPLNDKGNWFLPMCGEPWFVTAIGAKLSINLSAAIQVSGRLYYVQST